MLKLGLCGFRQCEPFPSWESRRQAHVVHYPRVGLCAFTRLWGLVMRVGIEMEGQPPSAGRGSSAGWLPAVSCGGGGGGGGGCVCVQPGQPWGHEIAVSPVCCYTKPFPSDLGTWQLGKAEDSSEAGDDSTPRALKPTPSLPCPPLLCFSSSSLCALALPCVHPCRRRSGTMEPPEGILTEGGGAGHSR